MEQTSEHVSDHDPQIAISSLVTVTLTEICCGNVTKIEFSSDGCGVTDVAYEWSAVQAASIRAVIKSTTETIRNITRTQFVTSEHTRAL